MAQIDMLMGDTPIVFDAIEFKAGTVPVDHSPNNPQLQFYKQIRAMHDDAARITGVPAAMAAPYYHPFLNTDPIE